MAADAQDLRPIEWAHYGFTVTQAGIRVAVIARAQYLDREGIEWGYCFSVNEPKGMFRAIPPGIPRLDPGVGEETIRLIGAGKAVPSNFVAQLRELPEAVWKLTRFLRV